MMRALTKAAFLDRDGVINYDSGYIGKAEEFELIPGVIEALQQLQRLGYTLIVITNQSGIGRGYYTEEDYLRVTKRMCDILAGHGVEFAAILHCPHLPDDQCECRKPMPGMLIAGAARTGVFLESSILFGDKISDIVAGRNAGLARCFLVGLADENDSINIDGCGADLFACVQLLVASSESS